MQKINSVDVVPYNSDWTNLFAMQAAIIQEVLGDNCIAVYHIGSTSVEGLAAKPVIDIIPVVRNINLVDAVNTKFAALGYEVKGEYGMLFRRFFKKADSNVHVYQDGNAEIDHHLKFRDWMRTHKEDRDAYAALKIKLAQKFANNMSDYCLGKDEFITSIDKKTGFSGLRIVKALTPIQWDTLKQFRMQYFFAPNRTDDLYAWTFNHPQHEHLVLYKGVEIIGYAHIQLWSDARAAMRMLVIDETRRNNSYGGQFIYLCEAWLKNQNYKSIHVGSSKAALAFYKKNGYIDMPFHDPDGYEFGEEDIAVGKQFINEIIP